jgi:hypothetical protein
MVYRSAFAQIFPRSQPMTESKTSIPSILTSAVTASCHFFFGLLLFHFPPSPSTNDILACLCSAFLLTYPSHLCAFMCFVLLYTAYISLFVFRLHLPSSVYVPLNISSASFFPILPLLSRSFLLTPRFYTRIE